MDRPEPIDPKMHWNRTADAVQRNSGRVTDARGVGRLEHESCRSDSGTNQLRLVLSGKVSKLIGVGPALKAGGLRYLGISLSEWSGTSIYDLAESIRDRAGGHRSPT
jgi:hypothetical protein